MSKFPAQDVKNLHVQSLWIWQSHMTHRHWIVNQYWLSYPMGECLFLHMHSISFLLFEKFFFRIAISFLITISLILSTFWNLPWKCDSTFGKAWVTGSQILIEGAQHTGLMEFFLSKILHKSSMWLQWWCKFTHWCLTTNQVATKAEWLFTRALFGHSDWLLKLCNSFFVVF